MKQCLFILLAVFTSCTQLNKTNSEESQKLIETFFNTYEQHSIDKALSDLFATNIYFEKLPPGSIDKIKRNLVSYIDSIGGYCGYEIISKKTLGKSMVHYSYLVNYELRPLRFSFILYKPKDAWVLYDFQFDSGIVDELKEAAKFYYLE